jgi:1-acyl-sn-glycerol-3-phosphate acyltransferase
MVQHIPIISPTTKQKMTSSSASSVNRGVINSAPPAVSSLNLITAALTKFGMMTFIAGMCLSLPLSLLVPWFLHKIGVLDRVQKEKASLRMGQRTARTLMTLIPFIHVKVEGTRPALPEPSVWVCNHSSMLDVFVLLAKDHLLRGKHRRPIKIVYWKQLEDNVITKLLFRQCGFIPVQMADNGHGNSNDYDVSSFRFLLKETKRAFAEGFDIGILPEGQLNPTPERGLLPIYSGAYTLAKMAAKRPIHMMAHYNIHQVWHPTTRGMMVVNPTCRNVKIRVYPSAHYFESANEFTATFRKVVGEYATYGRDLPNDELEAWTDGSAWKQHKSQMESSSQQQPSVD